MNQEIFSNADGTDAPDTGPGDPRTALLLEVLAGLENRGVTYALIHGDASTWPDVTSDVDIAFDQPPPGIIEPVLMELVNAGKASIIQRLHYEIPHG
jgi:hypothetical protein